MASFKDKFLKDLEELSDEGEERKSDEDVGSEEVGEEDQDFVEY
jgi:hypothetical protein